MNYNYKKAPLIIRRDQILEKKSLSGKDYALLYQPQKTKTLGSLVTYEQGISLMSEDFITEDICDKYRYIKTGNLTKHRATVNYSSTQYCKPFDSSILEDGDILIAKDGGKGGLGEACLYQSDSYYKDYICAEILRLRVNEKYDKWYILSTLKSQHFKDYMDVVTPEGTSFRHSKLLSLNYELPIPIENEEFTIKYLSLLTQNLVDKEINIVKKKKEINDIIKDELTNNSNGVNKEIYGYPKIKELKETKRLDTSIYTQSYFDIFQAVTNYKGGYFYLNSNQVKPGETPKDYKYSDVKNNKNFLWITPTNITTLELLYETFIQTEKPSRLRDYSIVLSSVRHLGYGYFIDKGQKAYCNQNTIIIDYSKDKNEQIFLLVYFTSEIGQKLQYAWRIDGLVPIIYSEDFTKIPIPIFKTKVKEKLVKLYYCEIKKDSLYNDENYLIKEKLRNKNLGIYQLNKEVLLLRKVINLLMDKIIKGKAIEHNYNTI